MNNEEQLILYLEKYVLHFLSWVLKLNKMKEVYWEPFSPHIIELIK